MNTVYSTNSVKKANNSKVGCFNECTLSTSSLQMHNGLVDNVGWRIFEKFSDETELRICLHIGATLFSISSEIFTLELRRIAAADYLLRNLCSSLLFLSTCGVDVPIAPPNLDQHIIERSQLKISAEDGTISIEFKVQKQSADDERLFLEKTLPLLVSTWSSSSIANNSQLIAHWQCVEDQCALREMISSRGVSFVADGSVLPRAGITIDSKMRIIPLRLRLTGFISYLLSLGGDDDRALKGDNAVPFDSPASLRATFALPHRGEISGMLIPKGVTVITGKILNTCPYHPQQCSIYFPIFISCCGIR